MLGNRGVGSLHGLTFDCQEEGGKQEGHKHFDLFCEQMCSALGLFTRAAERILKSFSGCTGGIIENIYNYTIVSSVKLKIDC